MAKVNVVIVDATGNKEQKVGLPDDVIGLLLVLVIPQYLLRIGQPLQEVGVSIRHNDGDLLTV